MIFEAIFALTLAILAATTEPDRELAGCIRFVDDPTRADETGRATGRDSGHDIDGMDR